MKPKTVPCLLTSVLSLALLCAPAFGATALSPEEAAVKAVIESWGAHFAKGDFDAISGLYTDDAKLLPPNAAAVSGRGAIRTWLEKNLASALPGSLKFSDYEIYGEGDAATSISEMEMYDGRGQVVERGKQTVILLKQHGQWKIHRDMWSDNTPPAAAK